MYARLMKCLINFKIITQINIKIENRLKSNNLIKYS